MLSKNRVWKSAVSPAGASESIALGAPAQRGSPGNELLEELSSCGVSVDKASMKKLVLQYASAEDIIEQEWEKEGLTDKPEYDWATVWENLAVLWERWFPGHPSSEMINEEMQKGYDSMMEDAHVDAATRWLDLWDQVTERMDELGFDTLEQFDEVFAGTQTLNNWVPDFQMELKNAAREDSRFYEQLIRVAHEIRGRCPQDEEMRKTCLRDIASAHADRGEVETAVSMYRQWLEEDPQWGWGWVGWSDCYWFGPNRPNDYEKSLEVLQKGLGVEDVRNKEMIFERMADVYREMGRKEEARRAREKSHECVKENDDGEAIFSQMPPDEPPELDTSASDRELDDSLPQAGSSQLTSHEEVGRNDPCPCGSGRKYKRCCGKKGR